MKELKNGFTIKTGYQNGLVGWVTSQHGQVYREKWNLGQFFECQVARQLSDFMETHQPLNSQIWSLQKNDQFYGAVTLDGSQAHIDGAQLRWFILDEKARGLGLGRLLLNTAIRFAYDRSFSSIHLYTLAGLEPAATLYKSCGFQEEDRQVSDRWGKGIEIAKYRLSLT